MNRIFLTVDVEDWQQSTWDRSLPVSEQAKKNTFKLLSILDNLEVKATMFIQGKFADAFPDVVKLIHKEDHEIACHGYEHIEIFKQTPIEFREDVRRAKYLLEDLTGNEVIGYRAPDFSIVNSTLWAFDELSKLDFKYDSSIFPIKKKRYGIQNWPAQPKCLNLKTGKNIVEFPIGTYKIGKNTLPLGGGGYFRLFPGILFRALTERTLKNYPLVFYCHPYEFNHKEFSEIELKIPLKTRLHQGLGRRWFEGRFNSFIKAFGGRRLRDAVHEYIDLSNSEL